MVGKTGALIRLHFLNGAFDPVEKFAGTVCFFFQSQSPAIQSELRMFRNEIVNVHVKKGGDHLNLTVRQWHLTRPLAAIGTPSAAVIHPFLHVVDTHNRNNVSICRKVRKFFSRHPLFFFYGSSISHRIRRVAKTGRRVTFSPLETAFTHRGTKTGPQAGPKL